MSTMDFLYLESSAEMSILYMQVCTFLICNFGHFNYALNTIEALLVEPALLAGYTGVKNKAVNSIE